MKLMRHRAWVAVLLACLLSLPASALTITPDYIGTWTDQQKAAFQYTADLWDTAWMASTAASGAGTAADTLNITVEWSSFTGQAAKVGPKFSTNEGLDEYYTRAQYGVLFNNALGSEDGSIEFNSNLSWHFGTETSPGGSEYDFVTVALQELGHHLGMSPFYSNLSDIDRWGFDEPDQGWKLGHYDTFLWDAQTGGNTPTAGDDGGTPSNFNEEANPIYFAGANAMAANSDSRVPIYAPDPYSRGVSLFHLDNDSYLMSYGIGPGVAVHTLTDVEWGIFQDLGWTMTPEPATAAFALLAAGAAIWARRRKRKDT